MMRSAPARASAREKYCPRPRLAPVTRATRPDRSKKFFTMLRSLTVRLEQDLHQPRLLLVEAIEPARSLLEGRGGGDEAIDVDLARGDEVQALRVRAARGARALQADLGGPHRLQRPRVV